MSGGLIRSALIKAAYAAAKEGTPISMHHLLEAAEGESTYRKRDKRIGFITEESNAMQVAGS